jgi:hypothetical protein
MNRQQFQVYVDHFNNRRYDSLTEYFAPDITVEYYDDATYEGPPARILHGREEFTANYKALHAHTREFLELGSFVTQGDLMIVELYTEFYTYTDPPAGRAGFKKGTFKLMTNWVVYNMDPKDKMKRIRILHFRMHDPKTVKFLKAT